MKGFGPSIEKVLEIFPLPARPPPPKRFGEQSGKVF